jgi:hypothetical protein
MTSMNSKTKMPRSQARDRGELIAGGGSNGATGDDPGSEATYSPSAGQQPGVVEENGLPEVLAPLLALPNWVCWKWVERQSKKGTKLSKLLVQTNGQVAKSDDPSTWTTFEEAWAARHRFDGVGFNLKDTGFAAFDIDNCRNPETGRLHPFAVDKMQRCESYTEVTVSNTGIRIIGLTDHVGTEQSRTQNVDGEVKCETYRRTSGRYIVVTFNSLSEPKPLVNIDDAIDETRAELDALKGQKPDDVLEDDKTDDDDDEAVNILDQLPSSLIGMLYVPDEGAGKPHGGKATRSEWLFSFLTQALGAKLKPKIIAKACLDPIFRGCAIHEHCIENGGNEYVARQIKHAQEQLKVSADGEVININKTHALVLAGNKATVMKFDEKQQFRLVSVDAFNKWFANQSVIIDGKSRPLADYWLRHKERRQYENIIFDPKQGSDGCYNLWRGFSVEPKQGDCSKFLDHIKANVARGNEDHYKWIIGWFGQIVQHPEEKTGTALALRGKPGTGKTMVGQIVGSLFNNHYELVSDPRYVVGNFNSHMASLLLLQADEAFWAGDKRSEGKLKDLVTGYRHFLEYKHVDPIAVANFIRLMVTSNEDWVVPAGFNERRFAIFDVGEAQMQNTSYFVAILDQMNSGGREALLHHLLNFDLSQVELRTIPQTSALVEQIIESASPEHKWWYDTLCSGELPLGANGPNSCPKLLMFKRYVRHAQVQGARRKSIETKLGAFLQKYVGSELKRNRTRCSFRDRHGDTRFVDMAWTYTFPELATCRERFAQLMGQRLEWDDQEEWIKVEEVDDDEVPF